MAPAATPLQLKEILDTKFRKLDDFRAAQPDQDRRHHHQVHDHSASLSAQQLEGGNALRCINSRWPMMFTTMLIPRQFRAAADANFLNQDLF